MKKVNMFRFCGLLALWLLLLVFTVVFLGSLFGIRGDSSMSTILKGLAVGAGLVIGGAVLHRLVDAGKLAWLRRH